MNSPDVKKGSVSILKPLWARRPDGRWAITALKGLDLDPKDGFGPSFFSYQRKHELMTEHPAPRTFDLAAAMGENDYLLKQSILPVVAIVEGEKTCRCIGTSTVISCSGLLMTATHVLLDPVDSGYGDVQKEGGTLSFGKNITMGVFIPTNPLFGPPAFILFPFQRCWYWGLWKESPLIHEPDRFEYHADISICQIGPMPGGCHQPLSLSLNRFVPGERAFAYGYARMDDIPVLPNGGLQIKDFDLYVSVGEVMSVFPHNRTTKEVPTPGPCFDFKAHIPGKMSGGPILGGDGAVVRGVISRSFSGEEHAYGAMLGPIMNLPLEGLGSSFKGLMGAQTHGIARVQGDGL